MTEFTLGRHKIGGDNPAYVIAELSANHNQSYGKAVEIIHAAKKVGVHGIKVQTYTPDTITLNSRKAPFIVKGGTPWDGRSLHDLYGDAYTPWEWQPDLQKIANDFGLDFFSSPFDVTAVDFLENMDVPFYKIASFECVHTPLIKKIAQTGKPVILSTGMATYEEIEHAVKTLRDNGTNDIVLLKCTSAYPAKLEMANLATIKDMAEKFEVVCGVSDHTIGIDVPVGAVSMGAHVIEKHFVMDRDDGGVDSVFSSEPQEFEQFMNAVKAFENGDDVGFDKAVIGDVSYGPKGSEKDMVNFRPSLWVSKPVQKGDIFSEDNIRCVRPGHGLPGRFMDVILGQPAQMDIDEATPVSWDMVETKSKSA